MKTLLLFSLILSSIIGLAQDKTKADVLKENLPIVATSGFTSYRLREDAKLIKNTVPVNKTLMKFKSSGSILSELEIQKVKGKVTGKRIPLNKVNIHYIMSDNVRFATLNHNKEVLRELISEERFKPLNAPKEKVSTITHSKFTYSSKDIPMLKKNIEKLKIQNSIWSSSQNLTKSRVITTNPFDKIRKIQESGGKITSVSYNTLKASASKKALNSLSALALAGTGLMLLDTKLQFDEIDKKGMTKKSENRLSNKYNFNAELTNETQSNTSQQE